MKGTFTRVDERIGHVSYGVSNGLAGRSVVVERASREANSQLGAEAPTKIEGVTLMRPIHSNL